MRQTVFLLLPFLLYWACESSHNVNSTNGEQLAKVYCASCHQYPPPNLLPKSTWKEHILPRMANMMGRYETDTTRAALLESQKIGAIVAARGLYPAEPMINTNNWKAIETFYLNHAPQAFVKMELPKISEHLRQFNVRKPSIQMTPPSTTLVKFGENGQLFVADAHTKTVLHFDNNLNLLKAANVQEGVVDMQEFQNDFWITVMGSFSPTDEAKGFLMTLPKNQKSRVTQPVKKLRRPVHTSYGDVNGDGQLDIIVSEFGKWTGRLSLYTNTGKGFKHNVLWDQTGATRTRILDFDKDGDLDILALFGQAREGVYLFTNNGSGNFTRSALLEFSPSHGSSWFDLLDFDQDGNLDIIYTAGDAADFPPIHKPYQGVYIFLNDGQNAFTQHLFLPLQGAYAALPRDYDLDGDMDIAAISFFPDYQNRPQECFVYYENIGQNNFTASTFTDNIIGRWIVMDAKDYDQDGDEDLILGSLAFEVPDFPIFPERWAQEGLPFLVLENTEN